MAAKTNGAKRREKERRSTKQLLSRSKITVAGIESEVRPECFRGLPHRDAGLLSRRVEVALVQGNWDHAHEIVNQAAEQARDIHARTNGARLDLPLEDVGFDTRMAMILNGNGVFCVRDIMHVSASELACMGNIGKNLAGQIEWLVKKVVRDAERRDVGDYS